jgi:MarR family transcriptional regulator, organic hydroperoxide resistance regulator
MTELSGFLLLRVANMWQRRMRKLLKPFGLTITQYLLLSGLKTLQEASGQEASDASVSQAALARHCRTDPMMTSQVLRVVENAALIRRTSDTDDGRVTVVALTEKGDGLFTSAAVEVEAADTEFHAALGENAGPFADALRILMGDRIRRRANSTSV